MAPVYVLTELVLRNLAYLGSFVLCMFVSMCANLCKSTSEYLSHSAAYYFRLVFIYVSVCLSVLHVWVPPIEARSQVPRSWSCKPSLCHLRWVLGIKVGSSVLHPIHLTFLRRESLTEPGTQ